MQSGRAVTHHSVSFARQDSEQAGLLARAQEIENLDKQLKAQALISEEARSALVRAEAAYADAAQRLATARRETAEGERAPTSCRSKCCASRSWPNRPARAASRSQADMAEIEAQLGELQEREVTAEGRFEELDMQLADSQERHAQLDDRVIETERKLGESREQQRTLERQAQEATFALRSWPRAARS